MKPWLLDGLEICLDKRKLKSVKPLVNKADLVQLFQRTSSSQTEDFPILEH